MDNVIILHNDYIAGFSEKYDANLHQHPILEIYIACEGNGRVRTDTEILEGRIIVIGAEAVHAIIDKGKSGLVVFVDPFSNIGFSIKENVLKDKEYATVCNKEIEEAVFSLKNNHSDTALHRVVNTITDNLIKEDVKRPYSESVVKTIEILCEEKEDFTMESIAERIHLSKSRLAHVFSQQTGIPLKKYIQFKRMERAFRQMVEGASITDAAYETGFSGSSHIASSSRKLTGMQLRKLLNL
ncbi:MAG: AraC family transcriptional regulator [Lachnospiraceae bacterium]|nr:AraC family transcriptional regulator [Lachnospiraceae bacterium]